MRKCFSANDVRYVLRTLCRMWPASTGNGTGHEVWVDALGRKVHPMLRKKDISINVLYALTRELVSKGICTRADFMRALKS